MSIRNAALMLSLLLGVSALADESVLNSPHDLSTFGGGDVRATNESRVCIFCHVPHNASPEAPLWNRHNPVAHYRIYQSPTVDARISQPGPASKRCLSCHDGSIALGLTLHRPESDPIRMNQTHMPSGPSNLTTDLSDDHPIGLRYDRALTNRDRQLRLPDLVDHRIQLGDWGELECTACHEPHNNEHGNFLRLPERRGALCVTCHDLRGWELSIHSRSSRRVPPVATNGERLEHPVMADAACRACHVSHSAPQRDALLYDRASRQCLNCHDGITAKTVLPQLNNRSAHHVRPVAQRPRSRRDRPSQFIECTDCHNPHAVQAQLLSTGVGSIVPPNTLPPAMKEVSGVSASGQPVESARFYYEVCYKCHADRPVATSGKIFRQRDNLGNIRRQFVPTNASFHPLTASSLTPAEVPSLTPAARQRRLVGCEDCHNNPNAVDGGGGVRGPHGSRYDFLLARRYETADFTIETTQTYDLCYQCHDRNSILNDESFPLHNRHIIRGQSTCSACHTPHGVSGSQTQHSHLINFDLSVVQGERRFTDLGNRTGSCTLTCHGVRHVNFSY
jgi:predicted CXXCH cytochrome family protein